METDSESEWPHPNTVQRASSWKKLFYFFILNTFSQIAGIQFLSACSGFL